MISKMRKSAKPAASETQPVGMRNIVATMPSTSSITIFPTVVLAEELSALPAIQHEPYQDDHEYHQEAAGDRRQIGAKPGSRRSTRPTIRRFRARKAHNPAGSGSEKY